MFFLSVIFESRINKTAPIGAEINGEKLYQIGKELDCLRNHVCIKTQFIPPSLQHPQNLPFRSPRKDMLKMFKQPFK